MAGFNQDTILITCLICISGTSFGERVILPGLTRHYPNNPEFTFRDEYSLSHLILWWWFTLEQVEPKLVCWVQFLEWKGKLCQNIAPFKFIKISPGNHLCDYCFLCYIWQKKTCTSRCNGNNPKVTQSKKWQLTAN